MRIKQVKVTGLFGMFTHVIAMNLEERMTIIHGPNGFGKTAILRMLDGLFNKRYSELRNTPFKTFRVDFEDRSYLQVTKTHTSGANKNGSAKASTLELRSGRRGAKIRLFKIRSRELAPEYSYLLNSLDDYIPGLVRISSTKWRYDFTNEILGAEEVLERFSDSLPQMYRDLPEPAWLRSLCESVSVHFIQTQRLFTIQEVNTRQYRQARPPLSLSVVQYSDELIKNIQEKLAEYAALSQTLDRSFPARLVKEEAPEALTKKELRDRLTALEEKRSRLMAAGLLDKKQSADFQIPQRIQDRTKDVLYVYVKDVERKLSVFDEIARKIDLFKQIVSERFLYKEMAVSKEKGFTFMTSSGSDLSATSLSSGEQHELVLFYELLFKVPPGSLILIDEPEISLHVVWQEQFLRDLQAITELTLFDVIIATHSPQIIHDRWDITVELEGPASK